MLAIDAVRGVAVVAMIVWHSADAWLVSGVRDTTAFAAARLIGGLAAPSFLFLAGVAVGLTAPERPDARRTGAGIRRGGRIVLGGYGLNLFAWAVDHGAVLDEANHVALAASTLGLVLLALALADGARTFAIRVGLALAGVVAMNVAWSELEQTTRLGATLLPRLDVLHGIGAALVGTTLAIAVVARLSPRWRVPVLAIAAISIAALAVVIIGAPQAVLPASCADWIARGAPWPAPTTAGFPLFPWLAYALLGAAIAGWARGAPMTHAWALPRVARPLVLLGIAIVIAALTWEPTPTARFVLDRIEAMRSLFRLTYNVSVILAIAALIAVMTKRASRALDALALLGRSSLLIYCAHLELAFGLAGVPIRRTFGWGAWAVGAALLIAAMVALAATAEHLENREKKRAARRVHTNA